MSDEEIKEIANDHLRNLYHGGTWTDIKLDMSKKDFLETVLEIVRLCESKAKANM